MAATGRFGRRLFLTSGIGVAGRDIDWNQGAETGLRSRAAVDAPSAAQEGQSPETSGRRDEIWGTPGAAGVVTAVPAAVQKPTVADGDERVDGHLKGRVAERPSLYPVSAGTADPHWSHLALLTEWPPPISA